MSSHIFSTDRNRFASTMKKIGAGGGCCLISDKVTFCMGGLFLLATGSKSERMETSRGRGKDLSPGHI